MRGNMILTVTLNPAVDKTYTAGELITGNVNRMRTAMSFAGGKGINVARVLRQYGQRVCATGFLGGYAGDFIEDTLLDKQVECQFIRVAEETRSSINILADNGYVTEILEPGPLVEEEQIGQFLELYEELIAECEIVVLSGILTFSLLAFCAQQFTSCRFPKLPKHRRSALINPHTDASAPLIRLIDHCCRIMTVPFHHIGLPTRLSDKVPPA